MPTFLVERFIMGGDVCVQTPHLSQEQEVVQMVWVCHVLPSLNASTKNTRLECRTWQRGRVGGPGFVATLRAYFDTRGPADRNPKPAPSVQLRLNLLFCSGRVFRGYLQRLQEQMRGGFGGAIPGVLGDSLLKVFFFFFFCLPGSVAQPSGGYKYLK